MWGGGGEAEGPHPRRREENEDTFAHGLGFAVAVVLSSLFPSVFFCLCAFVLLFNVSAVRIDQRIELRKRIYRILALFRRVCFSYDVTPCVFGLILAIRCILLSSL